jgi:hypothetical protein
MEWWYLPMSIKPNPPKHQYLSKTPKYVQASITLFKNNLSLGGTDVVVRCSNIPVEECVRVMADILLVLKLEDMVVNVYADEGYDNITIRRVK